MKKVDCLGDMCPIPIIKARKALNSASSGETIKGGNRPQLCFGSSIE